MKRKVIALANIALLLLVVGVIARAQDKPANVAGAWQMTSQGRNGANTQTITFTQDGGAIKGTLTGGRGGDTPLVGTVTGNDITFTVKRQTQNGEITQEYKGTVTGDAIKGTVAMGQRSVDWSATRSK